MNEHRPVGRVVMRLAGWGLGAGLILLTPAGASACPFCVSLKPTLTQRREAAAVAVLGEFIERDEKHAVFRLHQFLQGQALLRDVKGAILKPTAKEKEGAGAASAVERLRIPTDAEFKPGALVLLFGESLPAAATSPKNVAEITAAGKAPAKPVELLWSHVGVTELSFAYAARAPSSRKDAAERLRYFARYLEHDDPAIAEDAYQEFGHAPFDKVAEVADALDQAKLRGWLADERGRDYRKGFFGVALGLAKSADDRKANEALMRKLIDGQSQDFIAGFDGLLGGYLLLAGDRGLKHLEERYLANPKSADGHVRHTLAALRFYHEYGREIPRARLSEALRRLLDRPEFAAAAIVDLARWQDWQSLDRIAGLYGQKGYEAGAIKRSIVGYLLVCPGEPAAKHLDRLRRADPKAVADAEKAISLFGGSR
jgi:hypothetical protein